MITVLALGVTVWAAATSALICVAGALGRRAAVALWCWLGDRRAIRAAAALPPGPDADPAPPSQGLTARDEALLLAMEHTSRHPLARSNGQVLADALRQGVPHLADTQLAQVCIALTAQTADIGAGATDPFRVLRDAIAMAAVDLASLERSEVL